MLRFLLLILLLACAPSIAYSQPGAKRAGLGSTPVPPCLTLSQRVHLGDSLARLQQLRRASLEMRYAVDTLSCAVQMARGKVHKALDAVVGQQRLTTDARADATNWKRKARRRGALNWLFTAAAAGAGYFFFVK